MEATEAVETKARIEQLNNDLVGWSDIYNGLRGNADFERRADFLWQQVFERIYKQQMPQDAQLAIEVTADAGERLQKNYPQNVERVEDGSQVKFFLKVDPPLASLGDPKNAGRVEIVQMGGPTNFRFGLNSYSKEGAASTRGNALTQREIVGFQIRPKPSPFAAMKK